VEPSNGAEPPWLELQRSPRKRSVATTRPQRKSVSLDRPLHYSQLGETFVSSQFWYCLKGALTRSVPRTALDS
jgi:hypothetical protein